MLSNLAPGEPGVIFLSEVLIEFSKSTETGYKPVESDNPVTESLENRIAELDRVLTPTVSANADVIVNCPWLGGLPVTLSEAMKTYPTPMIEEDPYTLLGVVMELLANRSVEEENEDSDSEDEAVESKDNITPENNNDDIKEITPDKTKQAEQKKTDEAKHQKESVSLNKSQTHQADTKTAGSSELKDGRKTNTKPGSTSEKPVDVAGLTFDIQPAETDQDMAPDNPSNEITTSAETLELPGLDNNSETTLEGAIELTNEIPKATEIKAVATLIYEDEVSRPVDLLDETILPEQNEEKYDETPEINHDNSLTEEETENYDLNEQEQVQTVEPEQPEQINFADGEVEELLTALTESIKISEPETAKTARELLDEIAEITDNLETDDTGMIVGEDEAQQEIEELIIKLFDELGIEYSPELIESMAKFTINYRLAGETKKLENEKQIEEDPLDNGTHEIIKDLIASMNVAQKVRFFASAIGKSALRLYNNAILVEEYLTR
jgi:hypothetical protein